MWSVQENSDAFFWYVAIPTMAATSAYLFRGSVTRFFTKRRSLKVITRSRKRRAAGEENARLRWLGGAQRAKASETELLNSDVHAGVDVGEKASSSSDRVA